MGTVILYNIKLWEEKTLADLVVNCQSAKVLFPKKLSGIVSLNIEWALSLPTAKVCSTNILAVPTPPVLYGICTSINICNLATDAFWSLLVTASIL